jgi:hypothetical protein
LIFFTPIFAYIGLLFGLLIFSIITLLPYTINNWQIWLSFNYRPDFNLLQDPFANQWLKDYALATCKMMLGEAREKFNQMACPQGGTALNGTALKGEGKAEMEVLEMDLVNYKDD